MKFKKFERQWVTVLELGLHFVGCLPMFSMFYFHCFNSRREFFNINMSVQKWVLLPLSVVIAAASWIIAGIPLLLVALLNHGKTDIRS